MASTRLGAHRLQLTDEIAVLGQLAAQVTPPSAMDASPAKGPLNMAVIDRDQVRALACKQLACRDLAEPVPVLRPRLNVVQQLPQLPGRAARGDERLQPHRQPESPPAGSARAGH